MDRTRLHYLLMTLQCFLKTFAPCLTSLYPFVHCSKFTGPWWCSISYLVYFWRQFLAHNCLQFIKAVLFKGNLPAERILYCSSDLRFAISGGMLRSGCTSVWNKESHASWNEQHKRRNIKYPVGLL